MAVLPKTEEKEVFTEISPAKFPDVAGNYRPYHRTGSGARSMQRVRHGKTPPPYNLTTSHAALHLLQAGRKAQRMTVTIGTTVHAAGLLWTLGSSASPINRA
jgi:hypothetical protein